MNLITSLFLQLKAYFNCGKRWLRGCLKEIIRKRTSINPNKMVIMTITFRYNCNPKFIYEEIKRQGLHYEIVWLVNRAYKKGGFPKDAKVVFYDSIQAAREVYSAKILLDNGVAFSEYFTKKEGQIHIQTMHGSLGIKRLDNSITSRERKGRHGLKVIEEEKSTQYVLTNSKFEEDVFKSVFWKDSEMLRLGHARTDVLFGNREPENQKIRSRLRKKYRIPKEKKLVLYAPTHRRGLMEKDLFIHYLDLAEALKKTFGGEFVFLLRLHYKSRKLAIHNDFRHLVYNVTNYPDIQELMQVADIAISDYSSWMFDYVLTRRPGFIFATDLERYNNITGLYYPLEETPFPVCKSNAELIDAAYHFDMGQYQRKVEEFLQEKECVDDGKSAERAVNFIKWVMAEEASGERF